MSSALYLVDCVHVTLDSCFLPCLLFVHNASAWLWQEIEALREVVKEGERQDNNALRRGHGRREAG